MSYLLTARKRGLGLAPQMISPINLANYRLAFSGGAVRPIIYASSGQPANLAPPAPTPVAPSAATPAVEPAPVSSLAPASSASTAAVQSPAGPQTSAAVSSGPPSTWPTDQPYTDAAGNLWNWNAQTGWQISAPANAGSAISSYFSGALAWLQSNSLLSGFGFSFPNWGVIAVAVVGGAFVLGGHHHGGRHRR